MFMLYKSYNVNKLKEICFGCGFFLSNQKNDKND